MVTAIRVEVLPARLGDCLILECSRDMGRPWRMLVDGGPPDTWPLLESRLRQPDPEERAIDVAVITHVDSDHIGGMIPFLTSDLAKDVGDVWFNGPAHLPGVQRTRSIAQGESVVAALLGSPDDPLTGNGGEPAPIPWNVAFGRGPIDVGDAGGFLEIAVLDGPTITVLSPTTTRLMRLRAKWAQTVEQAQRPMMRELAVDVPEPLGDLNRLAGQKSPSDRSVPNGSSVAVLIEHLGASVLLAADAFGKDLEAGLRRLARARDLDRLDVDAFKLPHHGSAGNISTSLVEAAPARHYLVSSNGDIFHHPDDAALARVVLGAPPGPILWFNYRTARTERWAEKALMERHGHHTRFPDPADWEGGVVLDLPARLASSESVGLTH